MDKKRPITFILGAGFSVEQQFPLMWNLKDRVIHFLEAERHYRYVDYIRPDHIFQNGQFYAGLEFIDPQKRLGFEELLIKLSDHLKLTEPYEPCYVTDKVLRIGVARLFWCVHFFIVHSKSCYTNFAQKLKNSEGKWRIISFNWDILVEKSLSEVGASWRYSSTPNDNTIPIIKPHGSINWSSYAQNSNIVSEYTGWKPIGPDSTLSYDSCHPLDNPDLGDHNDNFRYCLYPGDPDQPQTHEDLKRLWKEVNEAIQSAETVVFVGYSLPEYDSYAGQTFREFCKRKAIEVYDPSSITLVRFQKAFPSAELKRLAFKDTPYALRSA